MDKGPAVFAGAAFGLFGAALLIWTAARVLHRRPVASGAGQVASATVASVFGLVFVALGLWFFGRM